MAFVIDQLASVKAHWSADAITGVSDGNPVTTFPESISGWNMTGSGTTRPLYRTAGINSLPALEFDGTDDFLQSVAKTLTIQNTGVLMVIRHRTVKTFGALLTLTTDPGVPLYNNVSSRILYMSSAAYLQSASGGTAFTNVNTAFGAPSTNKGMFGGLHGPWQRYCFLDGYSVRQNFGHDPSDPSISATTIYANFGRNTLANSFFDGYLSEIVVWDETPLRERGYIEGVLAPKYGITLPASHPFYAGPPTSGPSSGSGNESRGIQHGIYMASRGVM